MSAKTKAPNARTFEAAQNPEQPSSHSEPCNSIINEKLTGCNDLLQYIPVGRENAITSKELIRRARLKDARTLSVLIHIARITGAVICSANDKPHGYFLPANPDEAVQFTRAMESRIREIKAANRSAKEYTSHVTAMDGA